MQITNPIKSKISTNLSMAARQMHSILVTILFIVSMVWVPFGTVHADAVDGGTSSSVKWHPGHYYNILSWGKNDPAYLAQVYSELADTPALRGIQVRYSWAELETSQGVYNFTSIDKKLSELAGQNKRLIILFETRTFKGVDPDTTLVPDYIKNNSIYEGGIFPYSSSSSSTIKGYNIKLWNPMVRDRLAALFSALGERFNSHDHFEGVGMTETALGTPITPLTSTQTDDFYNNMLMVNQSMREFFPNTMTFQFTNYPRPILESFIGNLSAMGAGLGGPDTFIEETGLLHTGTPQGVYNYYPELSGNIPLTPSVMQSNYKNTRYDGTGYEPTVLELLTFARDTLKANYIFWSRDPAYFPKVLEMLNWKDQTSDPAGGLDPTCPSAYSSCVN